MLEQFIVPSQLLPRYEELPSGPEQDKSAHSWSLVGKIRGVAHQVQANAVQAARYAEVGLMTAMSILTPGHVAMAHDNIPFDGGLPIRPSYERTATGIVGVQSVPNADTWKARCFDARNKYNRNKLLRNTRVNVRMETFEGDDEGKQAALDPVLRATLINDVRAAAPWLAENFGINLTVTEVAAPDAMKSLESYRDKAGPFLDEIPSNDDPNNPDHTIEIGVMSTDLSRGVNLPFKNTSFGQLRSNGVGKVAIPAFYFRKPELYSQADRIVLIAHELEHAEGVDKHVEDILPTLPEDKNDLNNQQTMMNREPKQATEKSVGQICPPGTADAKQFTPKGPFTLHLPVSAKSPARGLSE